SCIAVSPDGKYLAVSSLDKSTSVHDLKSNRMLYTIETTAMPIRSVAFASDSQYLVTFRSAGTSRSVNYRDPKTGRSRDIGITKVIPKETETMAVSQDGRTIFASWLSGGTVLRRYDRLMHTSTNVQSRYVGRTSAATFSPDGTTLITGTPDGRLGMGEFLGSVLEVQAIHQGHRGAVNALQFARNGKFIASAGDDGAVHIWKSWKRTRQWRGAKLSDKESAALSLDISEDDKHVAVGRANGQVEIWSVSASRRANKIDTGGSGVTAVRFLPGSGHVVVGNTNGDVLVIPVER
ncbi:MAG: WD40 repeat domain-containing protein, partial [Planctomycetota bacterium]